MNTICFLMISSVKSALQQHGIQHRWKCIAILKKCNRAYPKQYSTSWDGNKYFCVCVCKAQNNNDEVH